MAQNAVRSRAAVHRRRRLTVGALGALLVLAVAALAVAAGRHGEPGRSKTPRVTEATPSTEGDSTTTSDARGSVPRVYAIGSTSIVVNEPGKELLPPHSPDGNLPAPRRVTAEILYPAAGPAPAQPAPAVPGAHPAAGGPFPLVVFGPGFDEPASAYLPLLEAWARNGFVVAALTFPLTNPGAPGGPYRPDILNQPADMAAVTRALLSDAVSTTGVLHGMVEPSEVVLSGQSDGGDTALALAYNTCCRSIDVAAVVVLSGSELHSYGGFPGTFFPAGAKLPPLLGFQGTNDPTLNPPAYTDQYFAAAPEPKYLVCLSGADHLEAYTTTDAYEQVVAAASTDFIDHYVLHRPGSLAAMLKAAEVPGVAYQASSCPLQ